jgi:hypothetical protein
MKKMFLVLFMVLALSGIAFADHDTNIENQTINNNPTATGGAGGAGGAGGVGVNGNVVGIAPGGVVISPTNTANPTNTNTIKDVGNVTIGGGILSKTLSPEANVDNKNVNINKPTINNDPTFNNTNRQGQKQGQSQKQGQDQSQSSVNTVSPVITANPVNTVSPVISPTNTQAQNNDQVIAPNQEVTFKSPTQLLNAPSQYVPELNFGTGRMKDVTFTMPNFAIYGIKKYAGEMIVDVLNVNANVKFKNYYKAILADAKDIAGSKDFNSAAVRIQVICAEAQKTWTTGGNLGGAGSVVSATGLGGGSGAGSIIPNWGGTKADDLFTIIFVKVAVEAKVSEIKPKEKTTILYQAPSSLKESPAKKTVFGKEVSD